MPHFYFTHPDWVLSADDADRAMLGPGYRAYADCVSSRDMSTRAQRIEQGPAQTGWGFAYWDAPQVRPDAISLGEDLNAPVNNGTRTLIRNRLGLSRPLQASSVSVADVLFELWSLHCDPDDLTSWAPMLRPDRNGLAVMSLQGRVIKSQRYGRGSPEWSIILRQVQDQWVALRREVEATERLLFDEGLTYREFQRDYAAMKVERRINPDIISTPLYRRLRAINIGLPPGFHARMLTTYAKEYGIDGREFIPAGESDVEPEARGTAFTENWNAANQDSPDVQLDWTELGGSDWDVVNNELPVIIAASLRCESAVGSENHFSQCLITEQGNNRNAGIAVRSKSDAENFSAYLTKNLSSTAHRLFEVTAGSSTQVGPTQTGNVPSVPYTIKLRIASGGAMEGFIDGVSRITETDDTHTGNVRGGLWSSPPDVTHDDFLLDDEAAEDDMSWYAMYDQGLHRQIATRPY